MPTQYKDIPDNEKDIEAYVVKDKKEIVSFIHSKTCFFYDTCSFRYHANLRENEAAYIFRFIKSKNGIVIITRCILMELASVSGSLNSEYVRYIREMNNAGIDVLVMYEEDLFAIMSESFATSTIINGYLTWAVRMILNPVSTILKVFENNRELKREVVDGKNAQQKDLYRRFFREIRNNKEADDNLGEEVLAICLHILSCIPDDIDERFCVITDDKGAAGKIDNLFKHTAIQYKGNSIVIYSTPKLVQAMYNEGIIEDKDDLEVILRAGNNGKIVVLGTRNCDLRSTEIPIECDVLAEWMIKPNKIHITF